MLGFASKTNFKKISDFTCAGDYLRYLYADANGVVFRCNIDANGEFHTDKNPYRLGEKFFESDFSGVNQYISVNSFFIRKGQRPSRDLESLKRINAFYVDIDCYKCGRTKEQVIDELYNDYFGRYIPFPTFIIDSGRGLYIIWKVRNEDCNAQSRWKRVEDYLISTLAPFGADSAVSDLPRILRIPFTLNSKSNSFVKIVDFNDLTYSIYDIANEYGIDTAMRNTVTKPATLAMKKAVSAILSCDNSLSMPDLKNRKATYLWLSQHEEAILRHKAGNSPYIRRSQKKEHVSLNKTGFNRYFSLYRNELTTLMSMRRGADCKREIALFLYRLWQYEETRDAEYALQSTLAFNRTFDCPLSDDEVIKATASGQRKVDKGQTYAYKISTLISLLDISEDELSCLTAWNSTLHKNSDDAKRDRKESNHAYYVRTLEKKGTSLKKDKLSIRRERIAYFLSEGKSTEEIISMLSISKATFYRDMAYLASSKADTEACEPCECISSHEVIKGENEASTGFTSGMKNASLFAELVNALPLLNSSNSCGFSFFKSFIYEKQGVALPTRPSVFFLITPNWLGGDFNGGDSGGGSPP